MEKKKVEPTDETSLANANDVPAASSLPIISSSGSGADSFVQKVEPGQGRDLDITGEKQP